MRNVKWTIGMPCYNNMVENWFTIQSIRMNHDMSDKEIVVIDNYGDNQLKEFVQKNGGGIVRYYRETDIQGVSYAKNKIFEHGNGEYVLVIDSHILLGKDVFKFTPPDDDMIQGPLMQSNTVKYWEEWLPTWRGRMWGIWGETKTKKQLHKNPFEIWAMGAGFFAVKKSSWLGFNEKFRGFGGETGYIQEKYRKAGRKVWCYPNMIWMHLFYHQGRKIPYPNKMQDRVRNYLIGFEELGLNTDGIYKEFGISYTESISEKIK